SLANEGEEVAVHLVLQGRAQAMRRGHPRTGATGRLKIGRRVLCRPVQMDDPSAHFSIRLLPGPFRTMEIGGLSLERDVADEALRTEIRAALARHGVLCVRLPAALEESELRALASMIGPIKDPVGRARDGSALRYGADCQVIDSGFVL